MILPQVQSLIDDIRCPFPNGIKNNPWTDKIRENIVAQTKAELKGWLSALEEVRCHLQNESKIDTEYIYDVEETIAAIKEVLG